MQSITHKASIKRTNFIELCLVMMVWTCRLVLRLKVKNLTNSSDVIKYEIDSLIMLLYKGHRIRILIFYATPSLNVTTSVTADDLSEGL